MSAERLLRQPLGEIQKNCLEQRSNLQKDQQEQIHPMSKQKNICQKQISRIDQLRNKYLKGKQNCATPKLDSQQSLNFRKKFSKISVPKQKESNFNSNICQVNVASSIDLSRTQLQDQTQQNPPGRRSKLSFSGVEWNQSTKSSYFRQGFVKNLSRINSTIESRLSRLQKQVQGMFERSQTNADITEKSDIAKKSQFLSLQLQKYTKLDKKLQSDRKLYSFTKNVASSSQNYLEVSNITQVGKINKEVTQLKESNYKQHLRKVNFIDEMHKKLNAIKTQKQNNIASKIPITVHSKSSNQQNLHKQQNIQSYNKSEEREKCHQLLSSSNRSSNHEQKISLAEFTPNLAQSEVFDLSLSNSQSKVTQKLTITAKKLRSLAQSYLKQPVPKLAQKKVSEIEKSNESRQINKHIEPITEQHTDIEERSLNGQFDRQIQKVPKQFVTLINRLAYFVEADYKFTEELIRFSNIETNGNNLKEVLKERLKNTFRLEGRQQQQSFFEISPLEMDPLAETQKYNKEFSEQQLSWLTTKTKNKILKLNQFYFQKIRKHFSTETIDFLVEDLRKIHDLKQKENLNVGNLTSYVNMRTGKNFRNRCFYKLLRRLENNQNQGVFSSIISIDCLYRGLSKEKQTFSN